MRSLLASYIFIIVTILISISTLFFSFLTSSGRIARLHMKFWGLSACWLFGVQVTVHGKENWKKDSGAIVLFNHTSFFDIFAMAGFLPDMRFGAKVELFKIPLFGAAMKRVGIIPIDRQRKEKVFEVYQQAMKRLSQGGKIALAPEGKRTSTPAQLAPFKSGPFIFALQSRADLIPVVIVGAYEILPKGQLLPNIQKLISQLHLYVLDPVKTDDLQQDKKVELQNSVRLKMQAVLTLKQPQI